MSLRLGKRQLAELQAHLSRKLVPCRHELLIQCAEFVVPGNLEMTLEPDLREMVFKALVDARLVYQLERELDGTAISEIASDLKNQMDEVLAQLHGALTTGQTMKTAKAAAILQGFGGQALGLSCGSELVEKAIQAHRSHSGGGERSARNQQPRIHTRGQILASQLPRALAAGDGRHAENDSWLASWILSHWPSDGPCAIEMKAGERVVRNWLKARRKSHPDDFWNPGGPIPGH